MRQKVNMFTIHDEQNAPQESCKTLRDTRESFGKIPNLEGVMAMAPSLLQSYSFCWNAFDNVSLSAIEQQVVYQTANFENTCEYCVPWHTFLSQQVGMSQATIDALRNGDECDDKKLEALHQFARSLVVNRGKVSPAQRQAFFDAGYTAQQALEVVLGLAIKTMSNYTNSVVGTPLDEEVSPFFWKKPAIDWQDE